MTITEDDGNGHASTIAAFTIGSASQQDYPQQRQQQQQQQQKQQQQKHGLLSRFRFRRRGNKKHTTNATDNVNKKNADDDDEEAITIITMDDDDSYSCSSSSSSASSSFDEIDVLLARPVMGTSYCDPIVLDKSTVVSSLSSSSATAASLPVEAATAITDQQQQQQQQLQQQQKNINAIIHDCLQLLSSTDIDQNRLALQRMELFLKGRFTSIVAATASVASSSSSSSDTMPHAAAADVAVAQLLVYGGTLGSEAELVRYLFSTLICNTPGTATSLDEFMVENTSCADDDDEEEDADADALFDWILEYDPTTTTTINSNTDNHNYDVDDDDEHSQEQLQQHPEGKADGILHTHALRILSHALDKLTSTTTTMTFVENDNSNNNNNTTNNIGKKGIASPLQGPMIIWKNIMQTLLDNIEHPARNINATGYSLRILRSLYEIEEEQYADSHHHLRILRPLVQHSFVAQLVYLVDFGQHYQFPMIQTEALFLWNQCCPQTNTHH